jgi:hypothetical protein
MNSILRINACTRHLATALLLAVACVCAASDAKAQTVVSKTRIGGFSEDIAYVSRGRLRDSIAILDGYEVFTVENARRPHGAMTKLFNVIVPELNVRPNGITYIESEELFAFNEVTQPTKLFLFDTKGQYKGTRAIHYAGGYVPQHMEGLAYIPSNSPTFPDHIVLVVWDTLAAGPMRFKVLQRNGQEVAEIFKADWPTSFTDAGIGDVAYLATNRLLVTTFDNSIWTMDFSGNILSGPLVVAGANGFEGIVQMNDDRIVAVNYPQSLMFFDENLNRVPESDRNDIIGQNLNTPRGVAWNTDTHQLLIVHNVPSSGLFNPTPGIAAVPTSLDSATQVVDLSPFPQTQRITYLPGEHLIAALHANTPRAILLFNSNSTLNSQIDLSPAAIGPGLGAPVGITFIPVTNEFVVNFNGVNGDPNQPAERRRLRVFSRAGTLVRTLDLSCTGSSSVAALTYFDDGGSGRFLILGSAGRIFVTDLDGNSRNAAGLQFREFNSRVKLGLLTPTAITAITTGPLAGAFAAIDNGSGEAVIFRIN